MQGTVLTLLKELRQASAMRSARRACYQATEKTFCSQREELCSPQKVNGATQVLAENMKPRLLRAGCIDIFRG